MVTYNYNQPYYDLQFSDLDKDAVKVLSFEGEEKISDLFEYRINLISEDPALDSSKILNKPASFILNRGDEDPIKIHGLISHIEQYGKTTDYVFYQVVLVPRLWSLNLVFQNEVYQKMEIKDVITEVLSDVDLSGGDYNIDLKSSYPENEYIVQYKETSLNFLNRRLEHYGIYYYFDHNGDKDIVVFTDANSKLPGIQTNEAIVCNPNKDPLSEKESISELNCCEKVVTGMVKLKDYDYMYPDKQLIAESQINDMHPGLYSDFGDHYKQQDEGDFLARVRNQELLSRSKIFSGLSDCRLFRAGYKFKIEQHYREDWNSEYILTELSLKGTQQSLFALLPHSSTIEPTFECKFEAIPVDIEYRPPRRTQIPKISGIMNAKIESGSDDEYAYLEGEGRYRAKMLFDLSDNTDGKASLPIRLSQPYSGADYGMHFPNHAGTEIILAFVDGDVDRPIGLGTIPNPSNASPSTSDNKSQSVIRTAGDNEIIFDDTDKQEKITIKQKCGNEITLEHNDGKEKLRLFSPSKNSSIELGPEGIVQKTDKDWNTWIQGSKEEKVIGPVSIKYDGISAKIHGGLSSDTFIGGKNTNYVAAKLSVSLAGDADVYVGIKTSAFIGFEAKLNISKSISYSRGTKKSFGEIVETHQEKKDETIVMDYNLDIGNKFSVKAIKSICFDVGYGNSKLTIDPNEITLKTKKITLDTPEISIRKGKIVHKNITVMP
ncbi:MAG: type VI secretion system tip protein VgrG [Bacteroidetes bacterium]|nr:type VI secretion system tip protein VgrG [Bacteroidota bacterium]